MQSVYNGATTEMYQRCPPHVLLLQACGALFSDVQGGTGEAKQPLTQDPGKSRITCRGSRGNRFEFNRRAPVQVKITLKMIALGITVEEQHTEEATRKQLFENMLVLEVFAGSSNLTIEIRRANLRGVAVDKTVEGPKVQSQSWI